MNLPGVCQGCRQPVHWNGFRWISEGHRHVCGGNKAARRLIASGKCGAWMPQAREWCARSAGHGYEHRSPFALQNAARARHAA